tara:strand:- start:1466 stop:1984 length:519 start_codon:yes stop_codon:yes gene_type:complete
MNYLLNEVPWEQKTVNMYGKLVKQRRLTCVFGEEGLNYNYSGTKNKALGWDPVVLDIKTEVEDILEAAGLNGCIYNFCLLNLYRHGEDNVGEHSDNEKDIDPTAGIASVSFGAPRDIVFKRHDGKTVTKSLESGSLLYMSGLTQLCYKHSIPTRRKVKEPRVNLTFRRIMID